MKRRIGLALVTLVSVLAAGIVSTFRDAVDELWKDADYAAFERILVKTLETRPMRIAEAKSERRLAVEARGADRGERSS